MNKTSVISRQKPKLVVEGRPSLEPGVERYVLKGGGTGVYALERNDVIEIALLEGGQIVEVLAFNASGKNNLAALGLTGRGAASGIQKILAGDSDDAARVRFGLFRRGLHIGRSQAAKLFGIDAAAGESVVLKADSSSVVVLGAPSEPMTVWDQTPASDVLVFIRARAALRPQTGRGCPNRSPNRVSKF